MATRLRFIGRAVDILLSPDYEELPQAAIDFMTAAS
jgi:hypothetical protein